MATTPRKTVKSNPLDSIVSGRKNDVASVQNIKNASKRTRAAAAENIVQTVGSDPEVVASGVDAPIENVSKARQKRSVPIKKSLPAAGTDTPVKSMDSASPTRTEKVSPKSTPDSATNSATSSATNKVLSAEEVLEREFSPKTAMVMIPAGLLEDDPLVDVHALHTVKTWSQWAVLGGLIPTPVVDTVAITGVQIKMIHALCSLYNVEFKKEAALAVVSGLVGGTLTTSLAGMGSMILGHLPVIGSLMKYTVQPALSYASTYALGRVFMRHFENNGTMADIDSKKLATYFKEQYARGRKMFKYEFKNPPAQNA
jgi:uncharacterized protein (DUF697 family)